MNEEIFNTLTERCAYIWGVDAGSITAETTFDEYATKSVQYSQMTTYLEDEFDIEVPYMQFRRCKTIGQAVDFVAELMEE